MLKKAGVFTLSQSYKHLYAFSNQQLLEAFFCVRLQDH